MPLLGRASAPPRLRSLAGLCCLLVLALGACSDEDPEPIMPDSTSESPSPSPSSSDGAAKPWEKRTKAGAVAFVKHWVDVFNEAGASGDTSELRAISADSCESCANFAEFIDRIYADGGFYDSKGWVVRQSGVAESSSRSKVQVVVRVNAAPERFSEGNDRPAQKRPASAATYASTVRWQGGSWIMERLDFVS